ncbi:MAG: hypothetical protein Q4G03_04760 [Planctomycetia bacterium]|nr:hypothetical protein [Planctomycetia bacterium]
MLSLKKLNGLYILKRGTSWSSPLFYIFAILLFVCLTGEVYEKFKTPKPIPDASRQRLVVNATDHILGELLNQRDEYGFRNIVLPAFRNDSTDALSDALRNKIFSSGAFNIAPKSLRNRFRASFSASEYAPNSIEELVRYARRKKADVTLFADVTRFETIDDSSFLEMKYSIVRVKDGQTVFEDVYVDELHKPSGAIDSVIGAVTGEPGSSLTQDRHNKDLRNRVVWRLQNFLLWGLFVLILPIITIRFIKEMVTHQSNKINAFTLALYTAIDLILAWFITAPNFSSVLSSIVFIVMGVCALLFNMKIMSYAVIKTKLV